MNEDEMEYVIVRGDRAGVSVGYLKNKSDDCKRVTLCHARKIWYWDGASTLYELATLGTSKPHLCKFPAPTPEVIITDAIEILHCTTAAKKSIEDVKPWTQH